MNYMQKNVCEEQFFVNLEFVMEVLELLLTERKLTQICHLSKFNNTVYRCSFTIFTSDGSLQQIEISQDPNASIHSACTSNSGLTLKGPLPHNFICVDYQTELLLVAGVSGSVSCPTSSENSGIFYTFI